jgi:enterochelin esterase-like enzyme
VRRSGRPPPEAADALFAGGGAPPCIVVWVDAWTSYGGSQFVDSPAIGRYHSYLCDEVVAFVDDRYRTLAAPEHRGIAGKSSGGFGAMITPMLRPDLFGGLASHAGDALYELAYVSASARPCGRCVTTNPPTSASGRTSRRGRR